MSGIVLFFGHPKLSLIETKRKRWVLMSSFIYFKCWRYHRVKLFQWYLLSHDIFVKEDFVRINHIYVVVLLIYCTPISEAILEFCRQFHYFLVPRRLLEIARMFLVVNEILAVCYCFCFHFLFQVSRKFYSLLIIINWKDRKANRVTNPATRVVGRNETR